MNIVTHVVGIAGVLCAELFCFRSVADDVDGMALVAAGRARDGAGDGCVMVVAVTGELLDVEGAGDDCDCDEEDRLATVVTVKGKFNCRTLAAGDVERPIALAGSRKNNFDMFSIYKSSNSLK